MGVLLLSLWLMCVHALLGEMPIQGILWWPRELYALQIEKKTCKLRKQLPQFDNTHAANAHNTTKKRNVLQIKFIWLCCEHLQCVSLFVCVVSIFTMEFVSLFAGAFSICMCFLAAR